MVMSLRQLAVAVATKWRCSLSKEPLITGGSHAQEVPTEKLGGNVLIGSVAISERTID